MNRNERKYIAWLNRNFPRVAAAAVREIERDAMMGTVGDFSFIEKLTEAVEKIGPALVNVKAQRDLLKVQTERARQGLEPLDASQLSPTMKVEVEPSLNIPTWAKFLGGGLLVAGAVKMLRR